ncbi:MAG TPA: Nramp family divalent metal transporter [Solirubrobacteraceae bacterium]|nr:Nramp family divalent metal transporter [Solirubrobacteraceae bacterium]
MTPVRPDPALEGAGIAIGSGAGVPAASASPAASGASQLERLLAKGRLRATLTMLGPAFVAAVAYVDPGNFATNIAGGAKFGYMLLWVVLAANLMAMLIQYLSAKVGIATDRTFPELFRESYPRSSSRLMWVQAEVMAMSTDVAEFVGAALGLNLLFGVPLVWAGVMTGFIAFGILALQTHGFRRFELAITALLGLIFLGFLYETLKIGPSVHGSLSGLVPHLGGSESLYVAVGIIGATVMPHAIYLHSALTKNRMPARDDAERGRVLRFERLDIVIALSCAGIVNMAMLAVAAKLFHSTGHTGIDSVQAAYHGFGNQVGGLAALAFAVALFASGASSSSVGTYAGQVVMSGFLRINISVLLRRAVTMVPALIVLAIGVNPTDALVLSQVVLSFGIPAALIPLVMLTMRRDVMGVHVNKLITSAVGVGLAVLITALNVFLIYQQIS